MTTSVRRRTRGYLLGSLLLAGGLTLLLRSRLPNIGWLAAWLLAVNPVAMLAFCLDKLLARREAVRLPETLLHVLALAGGAAGALLGMAVARHKTSKRSFRVTLFSLLLLEAALVVAWLLDAFAGFGLPSPWA